MGQIIPMSCAPYTPYQDDVFPPELAYSDEAPEEYEDVLPESWLNEDCDWSYWEWDDSKTDYWEQVYPEYFDVQPTGPKGSITATKCHPTTTTQSK